MAEYTGPATDNEADVIAQMDGHKAPDIYSTGDTYDSKHGNNLKFGDFHPKRIHNDVYRRFQQDEPDGYGDEYYT